MTVSQLFEQTLSLICAHHGTTTDASIFRPVDEDQIARDLENIIAERNEAPIPNDDDETKAESAAFHKYGFDARGTTQLYNGVTGEAIQTRIYMGPVYYQRLQKFVAAANYSISKGSVNSLTRQPLNGRASAGGLRIGEMELWTITGHGCMRFLREKMFDHSDGFTVYICRNCGRDAIVNHAEKLYTCKRCKDNADIAAVTSGYASKLANMEFDAMGVGIKRHLEPLTFENYE